MDKKELRDVIENLSTNTQVTIAFIGERVKMNGDFTVLNVKKGKGKGGSLLMELMPVNGSDSVVVGTPDSESVLNIVIDGKMFGYETLNDVPLVIKPDVEKSLSLKTQLKDLRPDTLLRLTSALLPEFNGVFTLVSLKASRGRGAQVVATLRTVSGDTLELWTYRHSGAIDSLEVA